MPAFRPPVFQLPVLLLLCMLAPALIPAEADAMFARMTEAQLIDNSDLIVTGALTGYAEVKDAAGGTRRVGVIAIDTVFRGAPGGGTVWLDVPQPGAPVSSSDRVFVPGRDAGLWYLRRLPDRETDGGGAIYAAAHPQRFVPAAQAGPAIAALRRAGAD